MGNGQKVSITVLVVALGALFYSASDMLTKHSDWAAFKTPAGVGELLFVGFVTIVAIGAALGIDISPFLNKFKGGNQQ